MTMTTFNISKTRRLCRCNKLLSALQVWVSRRLLPGRSSLLQVRGHAVTHESLHAASLHARSSLLLPYASMCISRTSSQRKTHISCVTSMRFQDPLVEYRQRLLVRAQGRKFAQLQSLKAFLEAGDKPLELKHHIE